MRDEIPDHDHDQPGAAAVGGNASYGAAAGKGDGKMTIRCTRRMKFDQTFVPHGPVDSPDVDINANWHNILSQPAIILSPIHRGNAILGDISAESYETRAFSTDYSCKFSRLLSRESGSRDYFECKSRVKIGHITKI